MTTNKAQEEKGITRYCQPCFSYTSYQEVKNGKDFTTKEVPLLPVKNGKYVLHKDHLEALASAERDAVERCVETIESFFSEFKDCMAKDCHHSERDNLIREIIEAIQGGKDEG